MLRANQVVAGIAGVVVIAGVTLAATVVTDRASDEQVDERAAARERNASRAPGDVDGDGSTDLVVYRPSTATFWVLQSTDGELVVPLGDPGDLPTSGDFDGDGRTDLVAVHPGVPPASDVWLIASSADGTQRSVSFGVSGDIPQPGDYDGDGRDDIAVFRAAAGSTDTTDTTDTTGVADAGDAGAWYIQRSSDGVSSTVLFGVAGDLPAAGDYDGDGITDVAVQRDDTRWIQQSSDGETVARQFGQAGDVPAVLDRDGDPAVDLAVVRTEGENQVWYLDEPAADDPSSFPFGRAVAPFQQRLVGDFDGDGRTEPAVFDPSIASFWIWTPTETLAVPWGAEGDVVLPLGVDPTVGLATSLEGEPADPAG